MTYENCGETGLILPGGRRVEPGGTFSDKRVDPLVLRRWVLARSVRPKAKQKETG